MADIAVFHPDITRGGGGETVALYVLDALVDDHSVTLYTASDPDFETLSQQYGVTVSDDDLTVKPVSSLPVSTIETFANVASEWFQTDLHLDAFKSAFIQRRVRASELDHDLLVSTANEFFVDGPSLQYIHFPTYTGSTGSEYETWAPSLPYRLYRTVCRSVAGARSFDSSTTLVTNSQWTREIVQRSYDHPVEVVYPPVNVEDFDPNRDNQETGFVTVGAIHESKRQLELIEILDGLRDQGIDTHLHIVGGVGSQSYYERVRDAATNRDYIHLEGYVDRERLVDLIEQHQYGLHGRKNEHFGIAVAEMVAGGVIPFVPDGGGQTEIIDERSELKYHSTEDAVQKITEVMTDAELQQNLRSDIESTVTEYSTDQFKRTIRSLVTELRNSQY
ncbi:glycosyltransferase family 4 protein [Halobacterium salinarum]|uniref:glycosyltransferase family 4 protein n=1 Tax=Halobacterium salinarum TaxID=2242 RepID=UPI001F16E12B|nr:glycosyltransferase family 4 protein [Halobacterium salinarum]MCF2165492.1 glycosyltransferase family 4 protein [Halobacterium salinarum]MCF2166688.1 glycosyltransferase family 4 protein [Halobacterium salinarum]